MPVKEDSIENSLIGQLLVATPNMSDPRFEQAVILICGHDQQGTMGIIINKLLEHLTFSGVVDELKIDAKVKLDMPVHYGGPIEMGRGFALHSTDYLHESSIEISDQFALTANSDILKTMAEEEKPVYKLLALGYSGWGVGQLEKELLTNSWLQTPASPDLVFDTPPNKIWIKSMSSIGIQPEMLSASTGNA